MIISASYKTDIPAFYGEWFMNRLRVGWCQMVNPHGRQVYTVNLGREPDGAGREGVEGIVFWTKNVGPFAKHLAEVRDRGYPFVVQHTVNGYPRELEARVADYPRIVAAVREVASEYGPRAVVWRYDPILFTSLTPLEWHVEHFGALAAQLTGATREVVISFAQVYQKTRRNLDAAARAEGFDWSLHEATAYPDDPDDDRARNLVAYLASIAREQGMRLSVCAQERFVIPGVAEAARCIDATWFGGEYVRHGNRKECACSASRDIGAYDTCPHGCVYCYAVRDRPLALARYRQHDPASAFLFEPDFPTIQVQPRSRAKKTADGGPASSKNRRKEKQAQPDTIAMPLFDLP
ncbi:MAG TPA: DUF1848 domain-containing protein [Ktedonobacterales bacterium]